MTTEATVRRGVILGKGAEARGANVGSETSLSASARPATQEILEPLLEPLALLGLQGLDRSPARIGISGGSRERTRPTLVTR